MSWNSSRDEERQGLSKIGSARKQRIKRSLLEQYGPICQLCNKLIDMSLVRPHPMSWTVDHIIRVKDGGSNLISNLQPAHRQCNQDKS